MGGLVGSKWVVLTAICAIASAGSILGANNRCRQAVQSIADPLGRAFELRVRDAKGRMLTLHGKYQAEREFRIAIRGFSNRSHLDRSTATPKEVRKGLVYRDIKDLTGQLLRWQPKRKNFRFVPLGAEETIAHGDEILGRRFLNPTTEMEAFTTMINGGLLSFDEARDIETFVDYRVNAQREEATYFESSSSSLRSRGVAIRTKSWYSLDSKENAGPLPSAKSMTLKVERGIQNGFHTRDEWNVRIPFDEGADDTMLFIEALRKHAGLEDEIRIDREIHITNRRYGIQWMYKNQKIGFVLLDEFKDERAGEKKFFQIELELLDTRSTKRFLKIHGRELRGFLKELVTIVDGENFNSVPKLAALDAPTPARWNRKLPFGPMFQVYWIETPHSANGFEFRAIEEDLSIYRITVAVSDLMLCQYEPCATAKLEGDRLYIRKSETSDWISVGQLCDEEAEFIDQLTGKRMRGRKMQILRPEIFEIVSNENEELSLRVNWK